MDGKNTIETERDSTKIERIFIKSWQIKKLKARAVS